MKKNQNKIERSIFGIGLDRAEECVSVQVGVIWFGIGSSG
jgi:hypothetical protein